MTHQLIETIKSAIKVTPSIDIVTIEDIFNVAKHAKVQRFIDARN